MSVRDQVVFRRVRPRPAGWKDPRDLLAELVRLMDPDGRSRGRDTGRGEPNRLLGEAPAKEEERTAAFSREIDAAEKLLALLIERARAVPIRRIPSADERRKLLAIADEWNMALRRRRWWMLPTLCETCCTPVFRRAVERHEGGDVTLPTVCSERCRHAKNAAASAKRRRSQGVRRRRKSR